MNKTPSLHRTRSLRQSTLLIMVFSIVTRILSFFFKIYLSRRVGAEILGIFQMCVSVFILFCTISASGVPLILSRKTAELTTKGKERELHSIVSAAALLSLGSAFLLIFATLIFRNVLPSLFSDERCVHLFYIMLPALVSTVIYQLVRGYMMGKRRYIEYSFTELLEEVIKIVACITLLSNSFLFLSEATALAIAFTATDYTVMAILLVLYFVKGGRLGKPKGMKSLIGSGAPITMMRVAAGFLSSFIAIALPAALMRGGATAGEAAAEYGRAVGMAFSLLFAPISLTGALSIVILPEAASLAAQERWNELRTRVDDSLIFVFIITIFFYVLYFVLGEPLGTLLFKDEKAGRFIAFSAGMVLPVALSGLINTTLNSLGQEKSVFRIFAGAAVVLVAEILLLPKYIGIYALSVAECSFYILQFIPGVFLLFKKKVCSDKIFRPAVVAMLIAFPVALIMKIIYLLFTNITESLFLRVGVAGSAGIICYILLLLVFKPIPHLSAFLLHNPARGKKKRVEANSRRLSPPSGAAE